MSLVKCIKRVMPTVICKYITQPITGYKSKQIIMTSIKQISFSNHSTTSKSILFGFSLLGLFGLDEDVDSELKLINTIKKGLLYLQVKS